MTELDFLRKLYQEPLSDETLTALLEHLRLARDRRLPDILTASIQVVEHYHPAVTIPVPPPPDPTKTSMSTCWMPTPGYYPARVHKEYIAHFRGKSRSSGGDENYCRMRLGRAIAKYLLRETGNGKKA